MANIRPLQVALEGERVHVYRNLNNGLVSIRHRGKVVAHVESVNLLDVQFKVQPKAWEKVYNGANRSVHAFAVGLFTECRQLTTRPVTYRPRERGHFFDKQTLEPVTTAPCARVHLGTVYI